MYMNKIQKIILPLLALIALIGCTRNFYGVKPSAPGSEEQIVKTVFTRGVNLATCFDVSEGSDANNIWMGYINDDTFQHLTELGIDVVRVPMTFGRFVEPTSGTAYKLQDKFLSRLDELLDLGEKWGITVIVDNHQWGYVKQYPDDHAEGFMKSVWRQVAEHCKNRSGKVVYELQNEPDGDWWKDHWHELQGKLIEEIRKIDDKHAIIVCANPYHSLSELPEYEDDNLIYTFHFYTPMVFTHQGGTSGNWTHLYAIGGQVPFPWNDKFDGDKLASQITNAGYKEALQNYSYLGTENAIYQAMDKSIAEARRRGVPLFMGEFGAIGAFANNRGSSNADRCYWHECVRKYAELNGVSWTLWTYSKEFGLFNTDGPIKFDRDLNLDLVNALGLTVPPSYRDDPDEDESSYAKVVLYDDDWGESVTPFGADGKATHLTIPCFDSPAVGSNCIKWDVKGTWQYLTFQFKSKCEDLTKFNLRKTSIRFRFKADLRTAKSVGWSIWCVNNKDSFTDPAEQHNWVMRYGVTAANAKPDGEWHEVKIPLKDFDYRSCECGKPYTPSEGHFTWAKMKEIEFGTFDSDASAGAVFYLDEVVIMGPLDPNWKPGGEDPDPDPKPEPDPDPKPDPDPDPKPDPDPTPGQNSGMINDLNILPSVDY